ncbi:MAG TPA: glycosyltransferase family 4 protein [Flavobacteriales bacterium]
MTEPLDLTVFTLGDSRKVSTWSNVPYFFTRTLERQGHRVQRVDIGPNRLIKLAYDLVWKGWCALSGSGSKHEYFRSRLNQRLTERRIDRALERFPRNHNIFITFSFGAYRQQRPYSLFCDMTFEKHIHYFEDRRVDALEAWTVQQEQRNLEGAQHIVSLFPELARELVGTYGDRVKYYGNVVNMEPGEVDPQRLIAEKAGSREIVFIGSSKYVKGLEALAAGVNEWNARGRAPITIHVIGMQRNELRSAPPNMVFHGYLDKAVEAQRVKYYDILRRASAFINPTPKWGSFSASCEAMYLCTPVVLFPYAEFVETFGAEGTTGEFLRDGSPADVADALERLLHDGQRWRTKALAAHKAVEHFTWDRYVRSFVEDIRALRRNGKPASVAA